MWIDLYLFANKISTEHNKLAILTLWTTDNELKFILNVREFYKIIRAKIANSMEFERKFRGRRIFETMIIVGKKITTHDK